MVVFEPSYAYAKPGMRWQQWPRTKDRSVKNTDMGASESYQQLLTQETPQSQTNHMAVYPTRICEMVHSSCPQLFLSPTT